jgi:hypothetical protein
MEATMSPAARVRREFRTGRPPKGTLPLHPVVVWDRATEMIADFRRKMEAAGLDPNDVGGQIIGVGVDDVPIFIGLDERDKCIKILSRPDVIAIGMVFLQRDREKGQDVSFSWALAGLSESASQVLKRAVESQQATIRMMGRG